MFARLVAYVRGIAERRRISAEVDDELRFHIDQEIGAHMSRGVSPVEARRMALRVRCDGHRRSRAWRSRC